MSDSTKSTTGRPEITADTTMEAAMRTDPELPTILMRFHIGGCSMCGFEPADTVAKVAEENGVPLADLLAAINKRGP